MATVHQWSGVEARALRTALRFSVRGFAAHLGIAPRTVSKWEAGGSSTIPLPDTQAMLDTVLSRADPDAQRRFAMLCASSRPSDLADMPGRRRDGDTDEVRRRELLRTLSTSGAALLAATHLRTGRTGRGPTGDDEPVPETSATTGLWQVYAVTQRKETLLASVYDHLSTLTTALAETTVADRPAVCRAVAEAYQLAGEIHVDADAHTEATHCYAAACLAAQQAGCGDLWAAALVRQAYVGLYDGQPRHVVRLLDDAEHVAVQGNTQMVTRQWVAAVRAEANAAVGDYQACFRDLAAAEAVWDKAEEGTRVGWLRFDGPRLPELRGGCLVAMGRYPAAEEVLLGALSRSTTPRRRSAILCDLAAIGARQGDADAVTRRVQEVVQHVGDTGSAMIGRRLAALRAELRNLRANRHMREIDDVIRGLGHDGEYDRLRGHRW